MRAPQVPAGAVTLDVEASKRKRARNRLAIPGLWTRFYQTCFYLLKQTKLTSPVVELYPTGPTPVRYPYFMQL